MHHVRMSKHLRQRFTIRGQIACVYSEVNIFILLCQPFGKDCAGKILTFILALDSQKSDATLQQLHRAAAEDRVRIVVGDDVFTRIVGMRYVITHIHDGGGGADVAD